ncbi:MAG: hypothetical protein AAF747_11755, partial [Planctomycetota bacterium]
MRLLSGLALCVVLLVAAADSTAQPGVAIRQSLAFEQHAEPSLDEFFTSVEPPRLSWPDQQADFDRMLAGELEWDEVSGLTTSAEFEQAAVRVAALERGLQSEIELTPLHAGVLDPPFDETMHRRISSIQEWASWLSMDSLRLARAGQIDKAAHRVTQMLALAARLRATRSSRMATVGSSISKMVPLADMNHLEAGIPPEIQELVFDFYRSFDPADPAELRSQGLSDGRRNARLLRTMFAEEHGVERLADILIQTGEPMYGAAPDFFMADRVEQFWGRVAWFPHPRRVDHAADVLRDTPVDELLENVDRAERLR